MFSKFSIGIYFSSSHGYLICLENTFSGIRVRKHELIDFVESDTLVQQIDNMAQYISSFVETLGVSDTEIHIGFPRELSIVRTLEFPLAAKEDLASTISYSLEKYIPVKSGDLYFDYTVLSENKEKNTISVLLAAAKKSDLKPFADLAGELKAGVSGVHVNSSAIVNYLSHDTDLLRQNYDHLSVCYSDNRNLEIILFKKNTFIHSQSVQPDDENHLFELIRSRTGADEHQKPEPVSLVLCGQNITAGIRQRFEKDPGFLPRSHGFGKYNLPSEDFMPAFGLALNGFMAKSGVRMNLLPPAKRKKPSRAGRTLMVFLMALIMIFAVISGGSVFLNRQMVQKNLDTRISALETDVSGIMDKRARMDVVRKQIDDISRLNKESISVNDILNELSRVIPSGSWVNGFTYNTERGVRISGQSDTASDLIPLLESSALFEKCVFLSAITREQNGKERFFIGFEISRKDTDG